MAIHLGQELTRTRILVVGDIMLDRYWFGRVDRISPEAPVPILNLHKTEDRLGGAGNVCKNLKYIGVQTGILSICGEDHYGEAIETLLKNEDIPFFIHHDPIVNTTMKMRIVAQQQQLLRVDIENKPSSETLINFLSRYKEIVQNYDAIVLSDYGKGSLKEIQIMIQYAKSHGISVFVDPKGYDYSQYRHVDAITPNRKELRQAIGSWNSRDELIDKVHQLRKNYDIATVLLTLSEEGMMVFYDDQEEHIGTYAKEVYDVSGAGDTVISVYAAAYNIGLPPTDAARIANRAAGIVVGKFGTYAVNYGELSDNIRNYPLEELKSEIIV